MEKNERLVTVAIHTYAKALILKTMLENEGIDVVINNVNLIQPVVSSGVRVRIKEKDLPLALKIIEQMTDDDNSKSDESTHPIVLIPIDFSDYSRKACIIGFDFAKQMGARVVLLHSYEGMSYTAAMMPFATDEIENKHAADKSHKKMDSFITLLRDDIAAGKLPGVKFTSIVEEGVPEVAIIECAKRLNAALIVMGTRGKSKKEEEVIGSVTAEVLDECDFPVFSVPEGMESQKMSELKNVAFFSNFIQQDLLSFDIFARIFKGRKLNITIIPIEVQKENEKTRKYLAQLVDYCRSHYTDFDFQAEILSSDNYAKDFDEYVKNQSIDLMLIPNKKRNIFARLFSPSVAHRMVFHSDVPLLVVPV